MGLGELEPVAVEGQDEDEKPAFDALAHVRGDHQYAQSYYADWFEAIADEVALALDNEQWKFEGDPNDQDEVAPKDLTVMSALRRKGSQLAAAPIHTRVKGQDGETDPFAAACAEFALESEVYQPRNLLRRMRARAIKGAGAARVWYLTIEWDARLRKIVYGTAAPDQVLPQPGALDIHDESCEWVHVRKQISVAAAVRRAREHGLDGDEIERIARGGGQPQDRAQQSSTGRVPGVSDLTERGGTGPAAALGGYTLVTCMYRSDPEELEQELEVGDPEPLEESERYMRCYDCGYETREHPVDPVAGGLPANGDPCPQCAEAGAVEPPALERVDELQPVRMAPKFPEGRWIEYLEEIDLLLYDGPWPYHRPNGGTLRAFPLGQYRWYDDPRYMIPPSDVSMQYNQQLLATFMLGWAVEQMRTSGRVIVAPFNSLVDGRGRPYKFTNRTDQFAYVRDAAQTMGLKEFQPAGLPSGWTELYGALTNSFSAHLGTGELGLSPQQSKDIPVGTVRTIVESGDIPTDDALRMIRDEDGVVFTTVVEMLQCCVTEEQWWSKVGKSGQYEYGLFAGADIGDVDVIVLGDPGLDAVEQADLQKMQTFFQFTPPQQTYAAKKLGLNAYELAEYQQEQMMFEQQQLEQQLMLSGGMDGGGERGADTEPVPPADPSQIPSYVDLFSGANAASGGGVA